MSLFFCLSITSHIIAYKIIDIFGIHIIPSSLTYMFCFVLIDIFALINDKRTVLLIIVMESFVNIIMIIITYIVSLLPSPDYVIHANSYKDVFSPIFTLYFANILGSIIAFVLDYALFKRLYFQYGYLTASLVSSTAIIIFYTVITDMLAFSGVYGDNYIDLTVTNIITNITFLFIITIMLLPMVKKIKDVKI